MLKKILTYNNINSQSLLSSTILFVECSHLLQMMMLNHDSPLPLLVFYTCGGAKQSSFILKWFSKRRIIHVFAVLSCYLFFRPHQARSIMHKQDM